MFIIAVLHILSLFIPLHFTDQRARTWSSNQSEVHWEIVAESGSSLLQCYNRNRNCNIQTLALVGTGPTRFSGRQKHSLDPQKKKRNSSKKRFKLQNTHAHTQSHSSNLFEKGRERDGMQHYETYLDWIDKCTYRSLIWTKFTYRVTKLGLKSLKWVNKNCVYSVCSSH